MHRHAYQGVKLSRQAGPREALLRGQLTSLVLYEQITTTLPKAKAVAPRFDRLVTKAKRGSLADQRAIRAELTSEAAVQKLMREMVPALNDRSSGYTRIIKIANRRGDNAEMAVVSVLVAKAEAKKAESAESKDDAKPEATGKSEAPTKKPAAKAKAKV